MNKLLQIKQGLIGVVSISLIFLGGQQVLKKDYEIGAALIGAGTSLAAMGSGKSDDSEKEEKWELKEQLIQKQLEMMRLEEQLIEEQLIQKQLEMVRLQEQLLAEQQYKQYEITIAILEERQKQQLLPKLIPEVELSKLPMETQAQGESLNDEQSTKPDSKGGI